MNHRHFLVAAATLLGAVPGYCEETSTAGETILYSFTPNSSSYYPDTPIIAVGHALYGASAWGFGPHNTNPESGAIYKLISGRLRIIYGFQSGKDGCEPIGSLLETKGTLYGTTFSCGLSNMGTVYSVPLSGGSDTILYSFRGGSDGAYPEAGLTELNGYFYGITARGGAGGYGTVFSVSPTGTERVIHTFASGQDGASPVAAMLRVGSSLFGTTASGGGFGQYGDGTVFKISASGALSIIHAFSGGADGTNPVGNLLDVGGSLYGTTQYGGARGQGSVFRMTLDGASTPIYSFSGGNDGANPTAGLIYANGVFYGTTEYGGAYDYGTVFQVAPAGGEQILYSFAGKPDGANPREALIFENGVLYGTTFNGGADDAGAIFSVKP